MALYNPENTLAVTEGAIAQLIGKGYLDADYKLGALDDTSIVSLGEKLELTEDGDFSTNSAADIVYKSLLSQLGKIVIDTRSYTASLPKLFVDPVNWGLFTEMVMIDISDVMIDEMWNPDGFIGWSETRTFPDSSTRTGPQEGARIAAIEYGFYKPKVQAKLYKKAHACMVALTTMYDQLFTAFKGVSELNQFLAGLYNSVENTLQLKAEVYAKMTVSVGIGKAFKNGNKVDLRQLAIAEGVTNASTADASLLLKDEKFQRIMLEAIANTKEYIKDYTALYNNGDMATFASDPRTIILSQVAKAAKFGVRANTYNEELLGIGDYDTVTMWQAATSASDTTPYNFDAASTIDFSKNSAVELGLLTEDSEATHYAINNVVGVIYDRLAMGITIDKRKVTTNYAASRDTSNSFYHALVNYVVNDSYPIVMFYIGDKVTNNDND